MAYKGKVISGDCHIDIPWLPADLFVSNVPTHLKDQVPHVVETSQGKQWLANGTRFGWVAGAGVGLQEGGFDPYVPGISRHLDRMEEVANFFTDGEKGLFHPSTPELRLKDQDTDGVSGEVIYGILGIAGGGGFTLSAEEKDDTWGTDPGIGDPELVATVYGIYNEWVADFCRTNPDRFVGLACITSHDPSRAAKQLRHAAEIGLRGVEMNVATAVEPIYHRDWDVLWAASHETGLPISFHTLGLHTRRPKKADRETYRWEDIGVSVCGFQLSGAESLSSIIFSGACDRFPNFKFVLGECGIAWIPYMLHRMDEEYDRQLFHLNLSLKPSELWSRQGYSTFQHEYLSNEMVSIVGEDNIMWGSDYPHPDSVWPDSRPVIDENLGHLDESALRKIVCDNTTKLYGFPN